MPKGEPISAEQQEAIIIDAAKGDFKQAAELHQVSLSTVYRIVGDYRPYYEKLCESYAMQGRLNTHIIGVKAQHELNRRIEEGGFDEWKTGTIIGLWETVMKVQEKYSRMDGNLKARDVILKGLRNRDPQIVQYVKDIITDIRLISDEELNEILNECESRNNSEVPGKESA